MRITFVAPVADMAGGIRVLAIYADRLRRRGHDVLIVSLPRPSPTLRQQLRGLIKGQGPISTHGRQESHFDGVAVPHHVLDRYRPVVDRDVPDADVIVASWWETAEWVFRLSPRKGAKAHFVQHHEVFDYLPKERVADVYRLPLHRITISRWLVNVLEQRYEDMEVSLVPNSVDMEQFCAPPRGKQLAPTVGFVYSTVYWKGGATIAKTISILRRSVPRLHVIAFGQEEPSPDLPLPAGTEYVKLPAQDDIKHIYGRCDVWLCGSESEGFCLPMLEAMACRCPVVSTRVGGPIDRIVDGVNGYLAPIGDAATLARRIEQVLGLPEATWRAMSEAAHRTATSYTWDDATRLFEQALASAIHSNLGRSASATAGHGNP
jgi:glycosyltransferase involved in cell wall biosynthesis